jgi:small subunit ribosomal protein S6
VSDVVKSFGSLLRVENWGRRRLAYAVSKHKRGLYIYLKYSGRGDVVAEIERTLGLQESVMKFQTVKLADEVQQADVKPEDIEFRHLEEADDETDETLAQSLGLEGRAHRWSGADDRDSGDDDSTDDGPASLDQTSNGSSDDEESKQ